MRKADSTDVTAGILLILAALFFGWQTAYLEIGTTRRMGPGFFPMLLTGLLFLTGVIVLIGSLRREGSEPIGQIAWRGLCFILPAPIFFGLTVRGLGFVPSLFFTSLIAAQASKKLKPLQALVLAVLVTGFSTFVFSYALGLPFRRFGPWWPF